MSGIHTLQILGELTRAKDAVLFWFNYFFRFSKIQLLFQTQNIKKAIYKYTLLNLDQFGGSSLPFLFDEFHPVFFSRMFHKFYTWLAWDLCHTTDDHCSLIVIFKDVKTHESKNQVSFKWFTVNIFSYGNQRLFHRKAKVEKNLLTSSVRDLLYVKAILRTFSKFTKKHLWWHSFLKKLQF